jgi:hypothetical protein
MFKRSKWLEKYGLVPKIFLVGLFVISLGFFEFIGFVMFNSDPFPRHQFKYYYALTPREHSEWLEWKALKAQIDPQLDQILKESNARAKNYGTRSYLIDLLRLQKMEEEYDMELIADIEQLPKLQENLRNAQSHFDQLPKIENDPAEILALRQQTRNYVEPSTNEEMKADLISLFYWLVKSYLKLMAFWCLIYLIRFQERKTAEYQVVRHNHSTNRFYKTYEPFSGVISLEDELILCPWRLASRIIFWPFFCMKYPFYETTAEMIRYNRLKAEFLRYKPIGYQLSAQEDAVLRLQAKKTVKNFEKAIAVSFELPVLVRRSAYIGYLSLIFGVLFQPALALAASYSQKVDAHFFGNNRTSLVEHQKDSGVQIRDGTSSGQDEQHHDFYNDLICVLNFEFCQLRNLLSVISYEVFLNLEEIIFAIEKVPLYRLFGTVRCLATVNQSN